MAVVGRQDSSHCDSEPPALSALHSQSETGRGAESEAVKAGEDQKGLGAEMRTSVVLWSETRDRKEIHMVSNTVSFATGGILLSATRRIKY